MAASSASSDETIQRVLYISPSVHVYQIPPLPSSKGHLAAAWTQAPSKQIFTARLRILETEDPISARVSTAILLEDPTTGELFAEVPYTDAGAVEQVLDSSRFFAVRVVGDNGRRRAVLGIGFEERSEAFDFGVTLQEARKVLGFDLGQKAKDGGAKKKSSAAGQPEAKRDFSLKDGQMLHIEIGGRGRLRDAGSTEIAPPTGDAAASFALLPPPPSAKDARAEKRRSRGVDSMAGHANEIKSLGFDDGDFGDFQ